MKSRLIILVALLLSATSLFAVPAYRGWQTKTQPDGTTIQVRLNGDEFYHFYTNRAGDIVRENADGYWQVVENQPSQQTIAARRKASPKRQSRPNRVGGINLAPRGLFILVNFKDSKYQSANTQAEMDKMMNADSYTYNGAYGSARKYFIDQSHGVYTPVFDVVGPVTLTKNCSYYGKNDADDNDMYPGDMIIEACKLADTQFNVDFTKYDNNHDGNVDFVYIIYAGKGEADGGADNTIWPHNWDIESAIYSGCCTYTKAQCKVDGLYINNYACSGELDGQTGKRNGIGTLCHEFSHVLGLPDYYDTGDGTNSEDERTPGEWDIMDYGSYNGDGNYPPNYSIHEKYFFGWQTPRNIGNTPSLLTIPAASADTHVAYQLNSANTLQSATTGGTNYYIENRQQSGWDTYLPGHGLLVWYVNYSQTAWDDNTPNNTANSPRYTVISASGSKTKIGQARDPFPGTTGKTSTTIAGKPLSNITETDGTISLTYIKDPNATTWDYEVAYEHCTVSSESGTVKKGDPLTLTITPVNGYIISTADHLDVTMGGTTLTMGTHFTYTDHILTIPAVTGDVEILVIPAVAPAKPYTVRWMADGELLEEQGYDEGELLRLPTKEVIACEGMQFIGWTTHDGYYDPFALPADLFSTAGTQTVNGNLTFYAIYR